MSGTTVGVAQSFCYYVPNLGDRNSSQHSGAYIFRPKSGGACVPIGAPTIAAVVVRGAIVQEVRQTFAPWLTQTVRLAQGARHAEFEWTVGAVPLGVDGANQTLERCTGGWRQTDGCDPRGARRPTHDATCAAEIGVGRSGYCECYGGRRAEYAEGAKVARVAGQLYFGGSFRQAARCRRCMQYPVTSYSRFCQ